MDREHPKVDQEQPKVDPGGSTESQIRHLDWAYIEFHDVPAVKSANAICNIVDRFSKKRHHIATNKEIDVERLADLFVHYIWKLHGLLRSIISDCGTQFVNNFWKFLFKRLAISVRLSTAWHPKTDGPLGNFI